MDTLWFLFLWFLDNWLLMVWGVGVLVAWNFGGWRLALAVGTLGIASVAYTAGQKKEQQRQQERINRVERELKNAYDEIDNRGTNRDDVSKRLRDGNY